MLVGSPHDSQSESDESAISDESPDDSEAHEPNARAAIVSSSQLILKLNGSVRTQGPSRQ